jgi:hypothetical protein
MTLRFTFAFCFISVFLLLPNVGALALLSLAVLAPLVGMRARPQPVLEHGFLPRPSRLDDLRAGRDEEMAARLVRAVESASPRPLKGRMAAEECRRLGWSHPDLVLSTLQGWGHQPRAIERFHKALASEPERTNRLITRFHHDLGKPALSGPEEVSIFLQLLDLDVSEILESELADLPKISPTQSDRVFVAEKFVTRLWSGLAREARVEP